MSRVLPTLALTLLVVACAGSEQRIEGVVVSVDGALGEGVDSFQLVTSEGERLTFFPAEGLDSFAHGGPLTHLSEHLQTGVPVRVVYTEEDGVLIARQVDDAM